MLTALLSVTKKEPEEGETFMGIREFARELRVLGWDILGSKGTAGHLIEGGIRAKVLGVDIMDHAVATLGMQKSGGLLAKRDPRHLADLENIGGTWIDLVCCDLYDLAGALANPKLEDEEKNDKVDIGGPTMLSECAKGSFSGRIVICDPCDRRKVIDWIKEGMPLQKQVLRELAAKADGLVSTYRLLSARWRSEGRIDGVVMTQVGDDLDYGENPQQKPARHMTAGGTHPLALTRFTQIAGRSRSFNNCQDLGAGLELITRIGATLNLNTGGGPLPAIAVSIKHEGPCGVGVDPDPVKAMEKMIGGGPQALMGGTIVVNFPITEELAGMVRWYLWPAPEGGEKKPRPVDVVAAPAFSEDARKRFLRKEGKCRLLVNEVLGDLKPEHVDKSPRKVQIFGDEWLVQPANPYICNLMDPLLVRPERTVGRFRELDIAIATAISVGAKSNTIVIVGRGQLLGLGSGQMDRVGAAKLAVQRAREAGFTFDHAVADSDSFFPSPDGLQVLAEAGVKIVHASSGSIRDEDVIAAAKELGVSLFLYPDRLGRRFKHRN